MDCSHWSRANAFAVVLFMFSIGCGCLRVCYFSHVNALVWTRKNRRSAIGAVQRLDTASGACVCVLDCFEHQQRCIRATARSLLGEVCRQHICVLYSSTCNLSWFNQIKDTPVSMAVRLYLQRSLWGHVQN